MKMPVTFFAMALSLLLAASLVPIETTDGENVLRVKSATESVSAQPTTTIKQVLNKALIPVCGCESAGSRFADPTLYHYEDDGVTPLIGRVNSSDRGMCQINMTAHKATTQKMGLDILNNVDDYIFYSNWLYETQGLTPWRYSKHCWGV